jgi:hypothetical protein
VSGLLALHSIRHARSPTKRQMRLPWTHTSLLPCAPLNADRMVQSGSVTDDLGSEAMIVRVRWWLHDLTAVRLRPVGQTRLA